MALAKMRRQALREALDFDGRSPWGQPLTSIDELHEEAMDYFDVGHAHYERTIQKYPDIVNGEPRSH